MVQYRYLYKLTHFLPTGTCCGAICCSSCSHCISTWAIVLRKAKIIVGTKVHRMNFLIRHATKENFHNNLKCLDMPSYFPNIFLFFFFFSQREPNFEICCLYTDRETPEGFHQKKGLHRKKEFVSLTTKFNFCKGWYTLRKEAKMKLAELLSQKGHPFL